MEPYFLWTECHTEEHLERNAGSPKIVLGRANSWAEARTFQRHLRTAYGDDKVWITDSTGKVIPPEGCLKGDYKVEIEPAAGGKDLRITVCRCAVLVFQDARPVPEADPKWVPLYTFTTDSAPEDTPEHVWVMEQVASACPEAMID